MKTLLDALHQFRTRVNHAKFTLRTIFLVIVFEEVSHVFHKHESNLRNNLFVKIW